MKTLGLLILIFTNTALANTQQDQDNVNELLRGGFSGGGGGTITSVGDKYVLIDFLTVPELADTAISSSIFSDHPFELAQAILSDWNNKPLSLGSFQTYLASSIIEWEFSSSPLIHLPRYFLTRKINSTQLTTVATYSKSDRKVIISEEIFQKITGASQIALFIHESLRHVQIGWDIKNNGFSEESLQEATVIFMFCEPSNILSNYVNFILNNKRAIAEELFGPRTKLISNECRVVR